MSKFMYCLVQLLSWEADTRKHKQFLKCEECFLKDKCKKYKADRSEDKDPFTQAVSDSLLAFSKQIIEDHEKEQNNE